MSVLITPFLARERACHPSAPSCSLRTQAGYRHQRGSGEPSAPPDSSAAAALITMVGWLRLPYPRPHPAPGWPLRVPHLGAPASGPRANGPSPCTTWARGQHRPRFLAASANRPTGPTVPACLSQPGHRPPTVPACLSRPGHRPPTVPACLSRPGHRPPTVPARLSQQGRCPVTKERGNEPAGVPGGRPPGPTQQLAAKSGTDTAESARDGADLGN